MKVEQYKCLKCGHDEFTVINNEYSWNYANLENEYQANTKLVCPKCGSEVTLMYPEWNDDGCTLIMCSGEKNRTHIFNIANIEGYKGHIVNMVDDKGTYIFFEKVADKNKESDKNVKYWSTLCAERDTQISDLKDKIKELEKGVQSWKAEADRAHIWLREDRKEKESLEAEIAYLNRRLYKTEDFVDEVSAAKIKDLEEELEKYKKQCSRLEHEKINAWASAHDNLNNANEKINKLEKENISLKNEYRALRDEYVKYQINTKDDNSYYKLWKDLADSYCKLDDEYRALSREYEKYRRDHEIHLGECEPTGTGCCLNKD